ncbi:MDR family NADP-dependent oxidoreductase [Streptomyces sp. NPDC020917]|uniref:MDR family NADP-dependent oxidoreductase n=1 Tax=Streptomyces sp. NPDC020917 TaxID=3365102 RepID=UPI0037AF552C
MASPLPRTSREVRLTVTPEGLPAASDLAVAEVPLPEADAHHLLVRNRQFLVFAALRTLIGGAVQGTPLPALRPGASLFGPALGEVVTAPPGSPARPGDLVVHMLGWREYALVPVAECAVVDPAFPDPVALLSAGSAAYGALTRVAPVREGDVVLVTGAAGGVGTLAGQITRLLGASRVIGTTGTPAKAARLRSEAGYDAVVTAESLRKGGSPDERAAAYREFAGRLAEAAPDGVDVVLDLVAGPQLGAAVDAARPGARIALVGALSGQLVAEGGGGRAPAEIDAYRLVLLGASVRGYLGSDHPDVEAEWRTRLAGWLRSGGIRLPVTRIAGIEQAPRAFEQLMEGAYFGTVVVEQDGRG